MTSAFRANTSTMTRLTPIGLDDPTGQGLAQAYRIGAGELLADARLLLENMFSSNRTGNYIITLHAIELGLKAFLLARGYTEKQLTGKPFGHDLEKLYAAAKLCELQLDTPNAGELITWCTEWHSRRVKIRYQFAEQRTLPLCESLVPLASEIINKIVWTNRVTVLNSDGSAFEVHTVPMGTDAYVYANGIVERDARSNRPSRSFLIENRGVKTSETAERVAMLSTLPKK